MSAPKYSPPGRFGDPTMTLFTDPRADPRMVALMTELGFDKPTPYPTNDTSPAEEQHAYAAAAEEGYGGLFSVYLADNNVPGIERSVTTIKGVDDNDIKLYISRPAKWTATASGPLPCVLHAHGGAMCILSAESTFCTLHRDSLTSRGLVVIGVEFRNASGKLGNHPFPAGLNDCVSAAKWVTENRKALGISNIVISGESGGGNLAIATAMKAQQNGWGSEIAGVFACCPYIHGDYANPTTQSLLECDGYFLEVKHQMATWSKLYTPNEEFKNPLAWPYRGTVEDLKGLPPMYISVNELDPLRDEGLIFYQRLLKAGVSATARVVNGTCHAGDLLWANHLPEVRKATLDAIYSFSAGL